MKQVFTLIICLLCAFCSIAQQDQLGSKQNELDAKYREDQFYAGFTFNLLLNRPEQVTQTGFSGGLQLGFIRDMPINKRRNVSFGLGVGYAINSFNHNLRIENGGSSSFTSLDGVEFNSNRFTTQLVEAPLQIRWRTSVADSHKFYRIYTGLQLGYMFYFKTRFEDNTEILRTSNIEELNPWRLGATFAVGYNTVNFYIYYSLNSLFNEDAIIEQEEVGITTARIGLMFYIL